MINWNIKTVVTVDEFIQKYGRTGASKLVEEYIKTCPHDDVPLARKLGEMTADLEAALKSNNYK